MMVVAVESIYRRYIYTSTHFTEMIALVYHKLVLAVESF